ncbi:hypothetical protein [Sinosporangium siamense]|uniref:Helix-turn-helix domain-containing protein n=1 Tax=Sinosporangium siamense TaxID=1367973 RepID=A0A919RMI3_9ACTN|nr:hypothetical protein [Sinosporangium siamense]GII96293.1 hypothetical protein Ssi02_65240 [Sinosporangium siamense]
MTNEAQRFQERRVSGKVKTAVALTEAGPAVIDVVTAGRLLGMGRTKAYQLAKAGLFPCKVIRIGSRYQVPVRGLQVLLGHRDDEHRDDQER